MSSSYPIIPWTLSRKVERAEGVYLHMDGRRILDAAGGAIVTNIGHGRAEVVEAVAEATMREGYVIPPWLTPTRERLMDRLAADWLPAGFTHVHLTCGGSEGIETAMKVALQYHYARGRPEKSRIVGHSVSYHGTTLATTGVGGHEARRFGLAHALPEYPSSPTPDSLRCPGDDPESYYVDAFERTIKREGPERIAAFIGEPIIGASGGAIVPPDTYWPAVRRICDENDILLIADEVMTGFGRTGLAFGHQHWPVAPDIFVSGKGLTGGYAPLTGIFATDDVVAPLADEGMTVMFHTFAAHSGACAAADKVLEIMTREDLVARAARMGDELRNGLSAALSNHPHVADVRGRGLLIGVEIVQDRATLERFPREAGVTGRVVNAALDRDVFFYGGGTGKVRDVIVLGPPFIVDENHVDQMVTVLSEAIDEVTRAA